MSKKKTHVDKTPVQITFKPLTENQKLYYETIKQNKITLVEGPAGCGKSFIATVYGMQLLTSGQVDKFIISRPIIESGREIGFLPGKYEDKIAPYVQAVNDIIDKYLLKQTYLDLVSQRKIETLPINYMRGRTFENAFVLLDEMQNSTYEQLVLALTRFGKDSKMVIDADPAQSDLPYNIRGGFEHIICKLKNLPGVGIVKLETYDIVREPIVASILERLNASESISP